MIHLPLDFGPLLALILHTTFSSTSITLIFHKARHKGRGTSYTVLFFVYGVHKLASHLGSDVYEMAETGFRDFMTFSFSFPLSPYSIAKLQSRLPVSTTARIHDLLQASNSTISASPSTKSPSTKSPSPSPALLSCPPPATEILPLT